MGRLIDADEMIDKYGEWYTEEGTEEGFIGTLEGVVYMMPTVEAIPVDWIQRYINACEMVSVMDGGAVTKWSADAVKAMLECWREEQLPTCGPDYCEIGEIHD